MGKTKGESIFLQYLDANNLYGWAMIQKLPARGYKWIDDFTSEKISRSAKDDSKDYLLETDIRYPKKLHDLHTVFPF